MEFTRIQNHETNDIVQFRINGKRVKRREFSNEEFKRRSSYYSSYTTITRNGNFKHVCHRD